MTDQPETEIIEVPKSMMPLLMRYIETRPIGEPGVLALYGMIRQCKPYDPDVPIEMAEVQGEPVPLRDTGEPA